MNIYEYSFAPAVQCKLLAALVRRPSEVLSLIEPAYFTNPIHVDIARIAVKALKGKNLKTDRLTRVLLWALVSESLKKSKRHDALQRYRHEVRSLYEDRLLEGTHLVDLARKFSLEATARDTLVEAERDMNAGNHDRAVQRFVEWQRTHRSSDSSIELPIKHLHRFIQDSDESDPADDFIVHPIIQKLGAVLLIGLPKELKSWMGAALAMDVATGSPTALGFFPVPRAARTLYVQVEDTAHMTANRMRMLYEKQVGRSTKTVGNLKVISRCPLNLMDPKWLDSLERALQKFKPELIVFDVFRRLFRGNVLDAKETAEFFRVLDVLRDRYKCAIVLVHHAKKGDTPEIQTKALGSVNLAAWADVLILLWGKRRVGNGTVSNIKLVSKAAIDEERQLVIRVDETKNPMVRVLDQERCDIDMLRACARQEPGLNQKELMAKSGFGEKKLRPLIQRAIELGLLREQHGKRKELRYFLPKPR